MRELFLGWQGPPVSVVPWLMMWMDLILESHALQERLLIMRDCFVEVDIRPFVGVTWSLRDDDASYMHLPFMG